MARIKGTDSDLSGGLPVSPDPEARKAQAEALKAYLDAAPEPTDPAVVEVLQRMKDQLSFVGSSEAAVDSDGPDTEVAQDTDSDTSTETGGGDAEYSETAEAPELAKLKADYYRAVAFVKDVEAKQKQELKSSGAWAYLERLPQMPWRQVVARLGEKNTVNPEKTNLEMVTAMQGNGEMVGVDENGKILFKDRGNEPVMFGYDKTGKAMMVYDRDERQMAQLAESGAKIADYYGIYEAVYGTERKPTGYELFPDAPYGQTTGVTAAVEAVTKSPFVKSANGKEWRSSWLDNGRKPDRNAIARIVVFVPDYRRTVVYVGVPDDVVVLRGAVRLLRV